MSAMAKKVCIVAACLAAVGLCALRLWPRPARLTPEMRLRTRVCEACGHRFQGVPEPVMAVCPKCHKLAGVRVHHCHCRACGEVFEAFRSKPADPKLDKLDETEMTPAVLFQREGGEWVPPEEFSRPQCPKCGSAAVEPHRPL